VAYVTELPLNVPLRLCISGVTAVSLSIAVLHFLTENGLLLLLLLLFYYSFFALDTKDPEGNLVIVIIRPCYYNYYFIASKHCEHSLQIIIIIIIHESTPLNLRSTVDQSRLICNVRWRHSLMRVNWLKRAAYYAALHHSSLHPRRADERNAGECGSFVTAAIERPISLTRSTACLPNIWSEWRTDNGFYFHFRYSMKSGRLYMSFCWNGLRENEHREDRCGATITAYLYTQLSPYNRIFVELYTKHVSVNPKEKDLFSSYRTIYVFENCCVYCWPPDVVSVVAIGMLIGVCLGVIVLAVVLRCLHSSTRSTKLVNILWVNTEIEPVVLIEAIH